MKSFILSCILAGFVLLLEIAFAMLVVACLWKYLKS